MGDVNLEIKLSNLDERVIKIEESGGGSGGDSYITSVSNDFNVVNKKLSLSNDVTTKLSKVDTPDNLSVELAKKIDKPASATNGQVLTYNGTSNEWEAQNSKGGADDTSIISDAYDELKTYVAGEYCIYNNSLWKCLVQHNGQTPTEGTYWTNVTVANEIASINSSLNDEKSYSLGSAVTLTTAEYTIPKNGVVVLETSTGDGYINFWVNGVTMASAVNHSKYIVRTFIEVKKGFVVKLTRSLNTNTGKYYPYVITN